MSLAASRIVWEKHIEPPAKKLVMLRFADKCDDNGNAVFFYMEALAAAIGLTHSSAQRYVKALVQQGLISVTANQHGGPPGTKTWYRVHLDRLKALPDIKKRGTGSNCAPPRLIKNIGSNGASIPAVPDSEQHQFSGGVAPMHARGGASAALNNPEQSKEPPSPRERLVSIGGGTSDNRAKAQQIAQKLRDAGILRARSTPELVNLLAHGIRYEDILAAVQDAEGRAGNPFAYGIAVLNNRLRAEESPRTEATTWEDAPWQVVQQVGMDLGVGEWNQAQEQFLPYKARVTAAIRRRQTVANECGSCEEKPRASAAGVRPHVDMGHRGQRVLPTSLHTGTKRARECASDRCVG